MKRTVIGLVGPIASGKGEVAKYLRSLGFSYFSLSDRVREEATSRGLEITRENLQDVGNLLRELYGGQILAERTMALIQNTVGNIVIDSIRNPSEIDYLKSQLGIAIIGIDASLENRLEWYLNRARVRGEDGLSEEDFFHANGRDLGEGEQESGQQVGRCLEKADIVIKNDSSKRQLIEDLEYHLILDLGFCPEGTKRSKEN